MRRLVPVALLLATACNKSDPTTVSPLAGFDPSSAEKTLEWAISRQAEVEKAPKDNPQARGGVARRYQLELTEAGRGKAIRWPMRVSKIGPEGECCLAEVGQDVGERGRFTLRVVPTGSEESCFPTSPPKADWAATLRPGDPVVLVGQIEKVQGGPLQVVYVLVDGHIERN